MDAPSGHRQSEEIRESIRKVSIGILEGRMNDLQRKQEKIEKDSASKGQDKPTSREKSLEKKDCGTGGKDRIRAGISRSFSSLLEPGQPDLPDEGIGRGMVSANKSDKKAAV